MNDLIAEYGSPYALYRAVYKNTSGLTIGMLFEQFDDFVYNSDLPDDWDGDLTVRKISVSSIVEGSDVEVEARIVDNAEDFWSAVDDVNEEVAFYRERDNSVHLRLSRDNDTVYVSLSVSTGEYWPSKDDLMLAAKAVEAHYDNENTVTHEGRTYRIDEEVMDSTF